MKIWAIDDLEQYMEKEGRKKGDEAWDNTYMAGQQGEVVCG